MEEIKSKTVKNIQENYLGDLECKLLLGGKWRYHIMSGGEDNKYELSEELGPDDWADIKLCQQSEKDAHEAEQAISQAISAVQRHLDETAQSKGYDNINSIAKYMGYDNQFRAECEALGAWCAACWAKCYELQAGGVMPDDLLSEMPRLEI